MRKRVLPFVAGCGQRALALAGGLFFVALLCACSRDETDYRQESFVFGTRVEITIHGTEKHQAELAAREILQRFDTLHRRLHAWQASDLDSLNAAFARGAGKVPVDAELFSIIRDAKNFSQQSDGLFNPAIGNLIRLWGFQSDMAAASVPDREAVARQVAAKPSMQDVYLSAGQAWTSNPAVRLDLGGYAKGYALDEAAAILKTHGVRHALINIGGNVMALGQHGHRAWKVGIQHPRAAGVIATLELHDGEAIGTSGDYQRYFESGGRRYAHLLDPRSGEPATGMQSVTLLISGERAGVKSDVLTKPLFIAGREALAAWLTRLKLASVMAIDSAGNVWVTPEMRQRLSWQKPDQTFRQLEPVR